MTQDEIDTLWQQALQESVKDGETFIRYHFAQLVAQAEREACAKVCDELGEKGYVAEGCAIAIRTRGNT